MIKTTVMQYSLPLGFLGRFAHKRTQLAVHSQGHEDQLGYAYTFHFQSVRSTFFGKCTLII